MSENNVQFAELPPVIDKIRIVNWNAEKGGALITMCKVDFTGCSGVPEVVQRMKEVFAYFLDKNADKPSFLETKDTRGTITKLVDLYGIGTCYMSGVTEKSTLFFSCE